MDVFCAQNEKATGGGATVGWGFRGSAPIDANGDVVANGGTAVGWTSWGNGEVPGVTVWVVCAS